VLSFPANRGRARALFTGPPSPAVTYPVTRHRWEGFLDAWREAGGAPANLRIAVCPANATAPAGLTTLRQSLRHQGRRCAHIALGHSRPAASQEPASWQVIQRTSTRPLGVTG
jgi:DNA-binding LacI/PurR family transcriptional regulator